MTIAVRWVAYGRPAAEALRATVAAAKGDDPLAPVTVVVPSNYVGVATRRLLSSGTLGPVCARGTGLAAVSFVTVYRLAELLGSHRLAGAGRRPVSTPVITAALRAALSEDPGMFAPVATHAATETALVSAYRELRDLSDAALAAVAGTSGRAADVVRLQRRARARLEAGWYDEEDLLDAAVAVLSSGPSAAGDLGTVVVYLPEQLSRHGGRLLAALGADHRLTVLAGATGDERADREVVRSVRRIDPDRTERPPDLDPLAMVDGERTRIVTASDCDEEVREAVRVVVDATRAGVPLDRIALLHASPQPYARLCHEQLAAAGIAHNGVAVMPLTARVAGRTLLQLLALPDAGFRRDDVFAWMAGAELHHDGRRIPVTAWERISRDAGVVSGRHHWDHLLDTFAADAEAQAQRAEQDPDAPGWKIERLRRNATMARTLRSFVLALVDDLATAAAAVSPWSDRARWAGRLLQELTGGERRRGTWPLAEQRAAEQVERALQRLAALDGVEGPVDLTVFTRTLELELDADLGRIGRMGQGVLVGSAAMGFGLDLDLVVVLGLAEGLFPAAVHDDSLLPDHERQAAGGELPLRAQQTARQHRQLLATLAGARRQVLCVPRGDLRRNIERVPSRWVLHVAGAVAGERWWADDLVERDRPWMTHVASFDAGLRDMDFPASEQEHRLRRLMAAADGRRAVLASPSGDDDLDGAAAVVAARRGVHFTRFDGNLAGLAVPSPVQHPTSATRLEGWASCPFAYLLRDVLRVEEVENPEDELEISPLDRGSLVHEVLERFIAEVLDRPPADRPGPDQRWTEADHRRMAQIGHEVCDDYEAHGSTGRPLFWRRERRIILAELDRFLVADSDERSRRRTRPVAAELAFGLGHAVVGTVPLALPDGRTVHFRGKADRVDVADDGTIHVVDYKTGKPDGYRGLSEDDPADHGRRLQLAVYGQAARAFRGDPSAPVTADYWFVSTRGRFERYGYSVTPAVLDRVGEAVGAVVAGIEAGVFPNRPTTTSTSIYVECAYCDPDALGTTELLRHVERKTADPAMAVFVDLVTPAVDDGDRSGTGDAGGGDGGGGDRDGKAARG